MGGGSGGYIFSRSLDFHSNGRFTTLPGWEISCSARNVPRSTSNWQVASPGNPMVSPNGCSIAAIRGDPTLAVSSGIMESEIVLNPAASISR